MSAEELEAGTDFGRYMDVDGDGIPWRTLPGTHPTKGAFFTRGTTKQPLCAVLRARPRLHRQHGSDCCASSETAAQARARTDRTGGGTDRRLRRHLLRLHHAGDASKRSDVFEADGVHLVALRLRAFPFPESVE
jgi:2-oxoglutarate ferredoxin oxidoreductase subunit alpha